MIGRRIFRALMRPVKRLLRPLRLRLVIHQLKRSDENVVYFRQVRADAAALEQIEHRKQVRLEMRRNAIVKGR